MLALTVALLGVVAPLAVASPGIDDTTSVVADTTDSSAAIALPMRRDDDDDDGDGDDDARCGGPDTLIIVEIPNLLCLEIPPS
ncbi:MAG: hypothetical protein ACRDV9_00275 [Acidimicrobiia bacterium]